MTKVATDQTIPGNVRNVILMFLKPNGAILRQVLVPRRSRACVRQKHRPREAWPGDVARNPGALVAG